MTVTVAAGDEARSGTCPLDLHEGIAHTAANRTGCERWPAHLRLGSNAGALVRGRCKATNLCEYCKTQYVIETVECLTLDALGGDAPTLWMVLTARQHLTRPELNEALRRVRQRMRRSGWAWEHFVQVEFQRRGALHANLLVKLRGGPGWAEDFVREFAELWCSYVDAEPVGQWGEQVDDALAVSKYVSKMLAHGLKREQEPPRGWKGHRTSHTRGYFGRPMWRVRRDAQASLRSKRALWRAEQEGYVGEEAELVASIELHKAERLRWELVVLLPDDVTGELRTIYPVAGKDFTTFMRSDRPREQARDRVENAGRALRALDDVRQAAADPPPTDVTRGENCASPPPQLTLTGEPKKIE